MQARTVGEVSGMLRIAIGTTRYYDKEGLLPFVKHDKGGHRMFTHDSIQLMHMIVDLKHVGVLVKEIAHLISWRLDEDDSLGERYDFLDKHEKILEQKTANLEQSLAYLHFKKWYYKTTIEVEAEKIYIDGATSHVCTATYDEYQALLDGGRSAIDSGNF